MSENKSEEQASASAEETTDVDEPSESPSKAVGRTNQPAPADSPLASSGQDSDTAERPGNILGAKEGFDPIAMVVSLMVIASMLMVIWNLQDSSLRNANTGSRYATVESLVDYGTYSIDKSHYVHTIDKRKAEGHYISSKPPTLPTYAAGVYWVFQKLSGETIADNEGDVVRVVGLFTGGLFHLIFLIYFYRLCRLLIQKQLAVIGVMAAACFAYLGTAYATAINNHSVAAAIGVVGLYYAFRIGKNQDVKLRHWILTGLCFGMMPAIDLPSGIFVPVVGGYLALKDWKKTLLFYLPMILPGMICQLGLGYVSSGSLIPAYLNSELSNFEGNYFKGGQRGIDALREPKYIYAFNALLGHHGLFSMTPVLGFGLWELIRSLKRRQRFRESVVVGTVLLIVISFYIYRTRNYGGWCVGMRWFVPLMPLLLLYFGLWLDRVRLSKLTWSATLLAFAVGAYNVQDGLTSPFQFSVWHNLLEGKPNRNRVGKKFNLGRAHKKALKKKKLKRRSRKLKKSKKN